MRERTAEGAFSTRSSQVAKPLLSSHRIQCIKPSARGLLARGCTPLALACYFDADGFSEE